MILELEAELIENDSESEKKATIEVEAAKLAAGQRIGEAQNDLAGIESEEREKLQARVNASVEGRSSEEDRKLSALKDAIERNRQHTVDHILKQILPDVEQGKNS